MHTCVHAYSHTAAVRLFSNSDRVLLAVGRETSGPASALQAPAGSGSDVTYHDMSHRGRMRSAQRQRAKANGAAMCAAHVQPPPAARRGGTGLSDGRSLELVRGTVGFRGVCVVRQRRPARRCSLGWRRGLTWCVKLRVSYESKVCNTKCIKCAYPFIVHPIVPLLAALLSVLGCPRPHHPPPTPRRHCSPQPR